MEWLKNKLVKELMIVLLIKIALLFTIHHYFFSNPVTDVEYKLEQRLMSNQ